MATNANAIRDLYNEGIREVTKIVQQGDEAQQAEALKTLDDLTAMMLAHTIETVQGRTALLTGLISELTQITDAIEVDPPYAGALDTVAAIVDKVRVRLAQEKKTLLRTG